MKAVILGLVLICMTGCSSRQDTVKGAGYIGAFLGGITGLPIAELAEATTDLSMEASDNMKRNETAKIEDDKDLN